VIDLEDGEPDIVEKLINFLYTHQYDDGRAVVNTKQCEAAKGSKASMRQDFEADAFSKLGWITKTNTTARTGQSMSSAEVLHINTALYIASEKYEYVLYLGILFLELACPMASSASVGGQQGYEPC